MGRLKAEMQAPPTHRRDPWNGVPRGPEPYDLSSQGVRRKESDGNGAPLRRETQSGIPGLTYDQAGRPV